MYNTNYQEEAHINEIMTTATENKHKIKNTILPVKSNQLCWK